MRLTFTGKIIALLLFTVLLLTLATSLTVHYYLSDGLNHMSQNEIDTKADAVNAMLKEASNEVKGVTYLLASRPDVATAIAAKDKTALVKIAKDAQRELRIEFVTIADAEGKVVKDANGDPILEQAYSVETGTVLTINTKEKRRALLAT